MPSRDYARSKSKKGSGKKTSLILALIISLLVAAGAGLWLLKEQAPVSSAPAAPTSAAPTSSAKSTLPSRPEEVYSYIRDLETREVPVDKDSKFSQLTKEQEQQILKRQEEERRRLEQTTAPQPTMPEVATTAQTAPQDETVAQKAPEVQQTEVKNSKRRKKQKLLNRRKLNRKPMLRKHKNRPANLDYNAAHLKIKRRQKICKPVLRWQDTTHVSSLMPNGIVCLSDL